MLSSRLPLEQNRDFSAGPVAGRVLDRILDAGVSRHWRLDRGRWRGSLLCGVDHLPALEPRSRPSRCGDTDDNLRMGQVRALLGGQGWFDLRQHRFDPAHGGANIHWSRLVDLPLAGLILLLKPLVGGADAERIAVAIAPLLPLLAADVLRWR